MELFIISALLALSVCANIWLFIHIRSRKTAPAPTLEAQQLLSDILSGPAIVKLSVLDPTSILIRSPRT